jgi:uracil-DNA glycosylase
VGVIVYCADIGSVPNGRFGWARADTASAAIERHRGGTEIVDLVESISEDLRGGMRVALGFECPLFVPVPRNPLELGKARPGEHNRSWSAGAGSGALATGLVQVAWILRELHERAPTTELHFDWSAFTHSGGLFIWEAFVTDKAKATTHVDDATVAVETFIATLPDPMAHNAGVVDEAMSLAGAAAMWSGWTQEESVLSERCLVIKAVARGAAPIDGAPADPATASKTHSDPREVDRKLALINEPHIKPLTDFVRRLRAARGSDSVPYFDPTEAGAEARILMLFENPGRKADAVQGSGFISPDNNDPTANNMWNFLRDAGIERRRDIVAWNIVPWYLGDDRKIGEVKPADIAEATPALRELLGLLPNLRVVILFGKKAQKGWDDATVATDVTVLRAPHPSGRWLNGNPEDRQKIADVLATALAIARS